MRALLERFGTDDPDCGCDATHDGSALRVDAGGCPGGGDLTDQPACRAAVAAACRQSDADRIVVDASGFRHEYGPRAVALFTAAGRFAARVADRDQRLAARARTDPLAAAVEASGRAGPVAEIAAETGFAAAAGDLPDYDALRPRVGPALADARIEPTPPPDGWLRDTRPLETGATVREYAVPDDLPVYHLVPPEYEFSPADCRVLADARRLLADGSIPDGEDAPGRAVREAAGEHREPLADALHKHTRGFGVLEDLFADPRISDVYTSTPVAEGPLRVTVDGDDARTNVQFTDAGAERLALRLRAASGRPFSRANPTLDTAIDELGATGRVRVAGVTDPVSDGTGFAFRAHDADPFRLPDLVANGTLSVQLAGFLVESLRRGAAVLFAGARGAGKTTLLGATLWGLAAGTRLVTIEDTPELPVRALRGDGRDVQALYTNADGAGADVSMADALRTALRLGDGAIAVGEVRGEEARVLYEAMRVVAALVASRLLPSWALPVLLVGWPVGGALVYWFRPACEVREDARNVGTGLADALSVLGHQLRHGRALEAAVTDAGDTLDGPTGEVFDEAARRMRRLRVSIAEAFLGERSPLARTRSQRACAAVSLVVHAADAGPAGGRVLVDVAALFDDLTDLDREVRREFASTTHTLQYTALVYAPLVAGVTVSLAGRVSGLDGASALPAGPLALVVGAYVLWLAAVLPALAVGLDRGLDRALVGYHAGLALAAATVYPVTALAAGRVL